MSDDLGAHILTDRTGRAFFRADASRARALYEFQRNWWMSRGQPEIDASGRALIIGQQEGNYRNPKRAPLMHAIRQEFLIDRPAPFAVLEIGAAAGGLLDYIKSIDPTRPINYMGFEMLPLLVDEFRDRFPEARIVEGSVEMFIDMPIEDITHAPFDLFVVSLTLCMIEPEAVRKTLHKATSLCQRLLIWDFLDNANGEIGGGDAVVFQFGERRNPIFAHPFATYLTELGWCVAKKTYMSPAAPIDIGWGLIDARPQI